jgi:hypothetical protein
VLIGIINGERVRENEVRSEHKDLGFFFLTRLLIKQKMPS